jgi:hypothetical protein
MTTDKQPSLDHVLDPLRILDNSAIGTDDGTTTQFLEIRKSGNGEGISINGNLKGLVHLARLVLEVAGKGFVGAHQHLDEASEIDICEVPLVISLKLADWDIR